MIDKNKKIAFFEIEDWEKEIIENLKLGLVASEPKQNIEKSL